MEMDRLIPMCKLIPRFMGKRFHGIIVNRRGMTFAELLMALGIFSFLLMVIYALMGNARMVYFDVTTSTELRNTLRLSLQKMEMELRNTGYDSCGTAKFEITNGAGVNGSDFVRFSIPVVCSTTATVLDCVNTANGAAANCDDVDRCVAPKHNISPGHWGAPLTWGCNNSSCMDADNSCATVEYQYVQYALDSANELVRQVLNPAAAIVTTAVLGKDITTLTFNVNGQVVTVTATAQKKSSTGRLMTETISQNIRLLN